ncbi:MAG: extracellular solute-binding protein [bacterium]
MGRIKIVLSVVCFAVIISFCGCNQKISIANSEEVVIWHWMTDRDEIFKELAKQFEKATGNKIRFELYAPAEVYSQKVRAAAQTNTLPDIFGVLGETKDFASFIKAGFIHNLDEEMKKDDGVWENQFFKRALASNMFKADNQYNVEPGIYGVPIDVTNIQMIYNKKLFRKAGLDPNRPPETWNEFINQIDVLKRNGIGGFVSGWSEIWLIDCFASNYAFNILGEEKIMDTYRGKVPYTDPDWIKVFDLFKQLRDKKALLPGTITMVNKNAEQNFANERAAFTFNGSWCVNVYAGMNPDLDYGVIMPPPASEKHPVKIWGWGGSSFVVNEKSKKKESCIEFLRWLSSNDVQVILTEKTHGLPSNKDSLGKIHPRLAEFAKRMDSSTHPSNWKIRESSEVIEAFDKGIQSILTGEKTPEEIAVEVDKKKKKVLAKNR